MLAKEKKAEIIAPFLIISIIVITQSQCHLLGCNDVGHTAEEKQPIRIIFPARD
jgi:hypothetical protein